MTTRMTTTTIASILVAATAAMNSYGAFVRGTLFEEDWEGGTSGTSVTASPYNWTNIDTPTRDANVTDTTPFGPGTLAFEGDTATTSGNVNFTKEIPSPLAGDDNFELTAQAYVVTATGPETAGSGTGRASVGFRNSDTGDYVRMFWQGALGATTPNEWRFQTWINSVSSQFSFTSGVGADEIVDLTVRLDLAAGMVYGTLDHSGGSETQSNAVGASFLSGMNTVALFADILNGSGGVGSLKVDNILVEGNLVIPEPGTFALLGIGSLVLRISRRRFRA